MEKFLMFIDDADDAATYPASRLLGMTCAGDGALLMRFESSIGSFGTDGAANDLVTLTITADTEKAVMSEISRAINATSSYNDGLIVVCDDVNSKFLHKNILSCAITLDT
tara:strand:+ start:542 stop:871 length:330 start_codon:yes stop_codon:yes gene_type:complete